MATWCVSDNGIVLKVRSNVKHPVEISLHLRDGTCKLVDLRSRLTDLSDNDLKEFVKHVLSTTELSNGVFLEEYETGRSSTGGDTASFYPPGSVCTYYLTIPLSEIK